MKTSRDSFVFYRSFFEAIKELDKDTKADYLDALCSYALDGEELAENPMVKALMTLIKPNIDANNKKFSNGAKGGRPKTKTEKTEEENNQTETKPKPNDNQDVTKQKPKDEKAKPNEDEDEDEDEDIKKKKEKKSLNNQIAIKLQEAENVINRNAFNEWLDYKKYKSIAPITKTINFLSKYDFATQQQIVNNSIRNGYAGIFEPKQQTKSFNTPTMQQLNTDVNVWDAIEAQAERGAING